MRCQNCGHDNSVQAKWCENCGHPMNEKAFQPARKADEIDDAQFEVICSGVNNDSLTDDYINDLERKFSGGVEDWSELTTSEKDTVKQAEPVLFSAAASGKNRAADQNANAEIKPVNANKAREEKINESSIKRNAQQRRAAQPQTAPAAAPAKKETNEPQGSKFSSIAIVAMLAIIAVLAIAIGILVNKGLTDNRSEGIEVKLNPNVPGVYCITVPAKAGTTLIFEDSSGKQTEQEVASKGNVIYNVAVAALLPTEPIEGLVYQAQPKIYELDKNGTPQSIAVAPIDIKVPVIGLEFKTPDSIVSDNGVVTIEGSVPTSKLNTEITVNILKDGVPVQLGDSVQIAEDGKFSYTQKLDRGEYIFDVTAQLGGHSIVHKAFNASVTNVLTASQIIVIPDTFVARSLNVEESIRVYGAVPAGSAVSVSSSDPEFSLKTEPTVDENGNFSFEVNLPTKSKSYKFTITATLADGSVFERPLSVERPPKYDEYVPSVWQGKYDEMIKPVHASDLKGFMIKGTISQILSHEDYTVAKLVLEDGNTIEIEYHDHYSSATQLVEGSKYTMYGYSLGTADSSEGLLRMFIWFVQD